MAEGAFRLPGASYRDLKNIVVAYGTRDEAATGGDVRKLDAVHRTSANRTNGFLVELGLLRGEREQHVTPLGRELARAYAAGREDEVRPVLSRIVSTSDFLQNVVSAVKIKHAEDGVDYESVQAYIAHAANQPRNKPTLVGSATVIELLKDAGLLSEDERGRILPRPENEPSSDEPSEAGQKDRSRNETPPEAPEAPDLPEEDLPEPSGRESAAAIPGAGPTVNIHLHIDCPPDELEELAPRLRTLILALKGDGEATDLGAADGLSVHLGEGRRFLG